MLPLAHPPHGYSCTFALFAALFVAFAFARAIAPTSIDRRALSAAGWPSPPNSTTTPTPGTPAWAPAAAPLWWIPSADIPPSTCEAFGTFSPVLTSPTWVPPVFTFGACACATASPRSTAFPFGSVARTRAPFRFARVG